MNLLDWPKTPSNHCWKEAMHCLAKAIAAGEQCCSLSCIRHVLEDKLLAMLH